MRWTQFFFQLYVFDVDVREIEHNTVLGTVGLSSVVFLQVDVAVFRDRTRNVLHRAAAAKNHSYDLDRQDGALSWRLKIETVHRKASKSSCRAAGDNNKYEGRWRVVIWLLMYTYFK